MLCDYNRPSLAKISIFFFPLSFIENNFIIHQFFSLNIQLLTTYSQKSHVNQFHKQYILPKTLSWHVKCDLKLYILKYVIHIYIISIHVVVTTN